MPYDGLTLDTPEALEAYDGSLGDPAAEPEGKLPEKTKEEQKEKIEAEEDRVRKLDKGINVDLGLDNTTNTNVMGIPAKDKYKQVLNMTEYQFDSRLKAKKAWLIADLKRLQDKYNNIIKGNLKITTERQKEIEGYANLIHSAARSATSYIASVKAGRRSKPAGKKAGE